MDDTNSLIEQRRAKLKALEAKNIFPFKNKFTPAIGCGEARAKFEKGELAEHAKVSIAGRITAHREMGKSMFIDVCDQSGRIQVYAQKQTLGDEQWSIFTHLDLGDFIGTTGALFRTKTNEPSVKIESFTILSKALRPPPAKWHGLEDTEIRYRQRYLDLMANPEVKDVFLKRSEIIREIRNFLYARGFVEVETPMIQAIPGGAAAQPFKTHHNALGCDFYLRIALELYLKRLLVGGVDKVFEIGRNFRNEGLSRKHNPEFTMLEAYQAFGDYESMMELVESMVKYVAQKVLGTLKIRHLHGTPLTVADQKTTETNLQTGSVTVTKVKTETELWTDKTIDLTSPWRRVKYKDLIRDTICKNWFEISPSERFCRLVALGEEPELLTARDLNELSSLIQKGEADRVIRVRQQLENLSKQILTVGMPLDIDVTSTIFEKFIEPRLIQPTFVTHLPRNSCRSPNFRPTTRRPSKSSSAVSTARKSRPPTPSRTIPSSSANASNIRPAASSKSWTRIFSSRSNTECRPPAAWAWAWALTACA
jgi:lysyl-tRNA synthetase class 2